MCCAGSDKNSLDALTRRVNRLAFRCIKMSVTGRVKARQAGCRCSLHSLTKSSIMRFEPERAPGVA